MIADFYKHEAWHVARYVLAKAFQFLYAALARVRIEKVGKG